MSNILTRRKSKLMKEELELVVAFAVVVVVVVAIIVTCYIIIIIGYKIQQMVKDFKVSSLNHCILLTRPLMSW